MKGKVILFETLWATLLGGILAFALLFLEMTPVAVISTMLIVVVVSVRQGQFFAKRTALLIGLVMGIALYVKTGELKSSETLVYYLYGVIGSVIGFFAKNIHRNLNNKKMATVRLNMVAAQVISTVLMVLFTLFNSLKFVTLLDCVYYGISSIALVLILAYLKPRMILTNRSRYLTSKERSKLLND